jgi:transposase-like protein
MDASNLSPASLLEAVTFFADPDTSLAFVARLRWPDGVVRCPRCQAAEATFLSTRRLWKCRACKKQFSAKVGTIFEDSPIALEKWLPALWLVVNCKNGISSYELGRALKVSQRAAWFMGHRLRLAVQSGGFGKISGEVEVDETFIGGKARFMHKGKRAERITGRGPIGKTAVMGLLERHGEDGHSTIKVARVVPNTKRKSLSPEVRAHVEEGSEIFTDTLMSYADLGADYVHGVINHAERYVEGKIHTNGLENFWSLLKR